VSAVSGVAGVGAVGVDVDLAGFCLVFIDTLLKKAP
jgi:hypothetical protein